ncbi:RICIN domain-containing protein [Actinacidiphila yeochonensis]|uniref:RICIN domain-containing protein n=1 Tax=Actinacidiphila yeochonensis TaxID=89050 RepID=UPI000A80ED6A|nr:RICIN domain-containing protein [Actinacidiphila yeochonensis]
MTISRRVLAVLVAAACVVLGLAASTATAVPRQAADVSTLGQITLQSVSNGRALDVQNGTPGAGSILVTNSAPGYDESWHVGAEGSDASFTVVNNTTGECVDSGLPLRQQPCDGRASELWYFQPIAGSAQHAFMIRHEGDSNCLDLWYNAQYDDAWTDSYGCNGSTAQQWVLPATAYQSAWNLAVDHAATQCQGTPSSCSWTATAQSPAAPLPTVCVSPVWYNATSAPVPWTFSINNTTGWASTIGFSLTSELTAGTAAALQAKVSTTVSGSTTLNISQTLGNSLTLTVPTAQYGWVALSELATQITGDWTFDTQGFPWTADDTVTVPLTTDPSGAASIYVARTSPTFTSCSA